MNKQEIKFKAQRTDGKGWIFGIPTHDFKYLFNSDQFDSPDNYEIIPETLCQFTGREDSIVDGSEVYKDDIIENCDTKELQVVYWDNLKCAWYCRYVNNEDRIVSLASSLGNLNKRIGNIHDK